MAGGPEGWGTVSVDTRIGLVTSKCHRTELRSSARVLAHSGSFSEIPSVSAQAGLTVHVRSQRSLGRCCDGPAEAHLGQYLAHSDCTMDGRSRGFHVQREGTRDAADGLGTRRRRGNAGFLPWVVG